MILTATIRGDNGEALGVLVLNPKEFKSGKVGYFGQAKLEIDGARYQCQGQLVRIGEPEPAAESEAEA